MSLRLRLAGGIVLAAASFSPALAQTAAVAPCSLLTAAEVTKAAGFTPSAPKSDTYGTTATCQFTGNALKRETVVVSVAKPAPKVNSSAAMAAWRIERGKRMPELASAAAPVEGLGAPAIRSDDGTGPATVEAAVAGRLLGITAPTFEAAQALAKAAIPRLH
jgi:hypothetical protein